MRLRTCAIVCIAAAGLGAACRNQSKEKTPPLPEQGSTGAASGSAAGSSGGAEGMRQPPPKPRPAVDTFKPVPLPDPKIPGFKFPEDEATIDGWAAASDQNAGAARST